MPGDHAPDWYPIAEVIVGHEGQVARTGQFGILDLPNHARFRDRSPDVDAFYPLHGPFQIVPKGEVLEVWVLDVWRKISGLPIRPKSQRLKDSKTQRLKDPKTQKT